MRHKNLLFLQIEPLRQENQLVRVRKDHVLALNTCLGAHKAGNCPEVSLKTSSEVTVTNVDM